MKFKKMTGDLIGVSVLAIGVAAVIGVGYLALVKFGGAAPQQQDEIPAVETAEIEKSNQDAAAPIPLPPKRKLATPKEKELAGSWQADFGSSKAFLQIGEGAFQLIYVRGRGGQQRKYSRGRYTYDSDQGVLVLLPDRSFGAPEPVKGVRYKILTMRRYAINVFKEKRGGALYWVPGEIKGRKDQIHPLFLFSDREEETISWKKSR